MRRPQLPQLRPLVTTAVEVVGLAVASVGLGLVVSPGVGVIAGGLSMVAVGALEGRK